MSRLLLDTHAFLWWVDDAPEVNELKKAAVSETSRLFCYESVKYKYAGDC